MTQPALRFPRGLYGVTPEWDDTSRLLDAIKAAFDGGMQVLQWRRKLADPERYQQQLDAVLALCQQIGLPLLINDHWHLATELPLAGAHIGRQDGSIAQARATLAPNQWLGTSCYNDLVLAENALAQNVDYIAFGAMYPSIIKPDAPRATLQNIQQARLLCEQHDSTMRPAVVAIGGIQLSNAAPLIEAGVDSVAVISGLFEATDIYAEARAFSRLFDL